MKGIWIHMMQNIHYKKKFHMLFPFFQKPFLPMSLCWCARKNWIEEKLHGKIFISHYSDATLPFSSSSIHHTTFPTKHKQTIWGGKLNWKIFPLSLSIVRFSFLYGKIFHFHFQSAFSHSAEVQNHVFHENGKNFQNSKFSCTMVVEKRKPQKQQKLSEKKNFHEHIAIYCNYVVF